MRWITVCGGGNGAHALVGTLLLRDETTHIRLYLPFKEERACFAEAVSAQSLFKVQLAGEVHSAASNRIHVTADPKEAALSPIIIMVVPAFAHGAILTQLAPYLTEESTIVAMPARSGLEYQAQDILGKVGCNSCVLIGFQTLPWACRIKGFGTSVVIKEPKREWGLPAYLGKKLRRRRKSSPLYWVWTSSLINQC